MAQQRVNGQVITKSELVDRLGAKQSHLLHKDVDSAVKHILEYLSKSLGMGKRIEIRGFGSFSLRRRKPRVARNPKTGAPVAMVGKNIPYFRPGKPLRNRIRNPSPPPEPSPPPQALPPPGESPADSPQGAPDTRQDIQHDVQDTRQDVQQDAQDTRRDARQDVSPPPREPFSPE